MVVCSQQNNQLVDGGCRVLKGCVNTTYLSFNMISVMLVVRRNKRQLITD